ncbi:hypothetical protein [Kocuria marina]|uniref:hypothetical protein n=1 Tax=Kocuria marina TaxID=223184 RepID=UPI0019CF7B5B|nr:hypothetical protein [Kocuria indica]MBN6812669.1 hypothetical protein [Kocuria indica]MBN6844313.1 hypothetical protein [Kocuria indica]
MESDDLRRMVIATGLAYQGHEQAKAYAAAWDAVSEYALVPLVRAVYETAVTAQWLMLVPGGWKAVANEYRRSELAFIRTLRAVGVEDWTDAADRAAERLAAQGEVWETPHGRQARHFEQMCRDLDFPDGYLWFRMLSNAAHASIYSAGPWVREPAVEGGPVRVTAPQRDPEAGWLSYVVTSLLLLADVQAQLEADQQWREDLAALARKWGTRASLALSEEGKARIAAAEHAASAEEQGA